MLFQIPLVLSLSLRFLYTDENVPKTVYISHGGSLLMLQMLSPCRGHPNDVSVTSCHITVERTFDDAVEHMECPPVEIFIG